MKCQKSDWIANFYGNEPTTSKYQPHIQSSLLGSTNSNFGEDLQIFCNFKKDERKEIGKKLPNEYKPLFIAKGL